MNNCIICGNLFHIAGTWALMCSDDCRKKRASALERERYALIKMRRQSLLKNLKCAQCSKLFDAKSAKQKYCSTKCCQRSNQGFLGAKDSEICCARCSKTFINKNGRAKYCSRTCKRAGTHSDYRSRAKRWNVEYDSSVTIANVIERFGRGCAECGELIIGEHSSKANQDAPSIDHIVPMSAGGAHVWSNVELVHLRCNLKRWSAYRKMLTNAN